METENGEGKSSKDLRSKKSGATKTPLPRPEHLMGGAESRVVAKKRDSDLLERLKATKPPRTIQMIEGIPAAYKSRAIRVLTGVAKNKARIRANCEQCVGWEEVSPRVGGCTTYGCMFWEVRPYQKKKTASEVST